MQKVGHAFCYAVKCSKVQLVGNGYNDVVIAINPGVPENLNIITKIKEMVTEASHYMFIATKKRAFFRNVTILLPMEWTPRNYTKPRTERYDKANVIIAEPFMKYGDDPYTLQYGGCGEEGRYIHFTPNFLLNDKLLSAYGPRGRVFVHEWAHLRWGVFDEYNDEKPFYISGKKTIEATRCSTDITGAEGVLSCQGNSCTVEKCDTDSSTGLYKGDCLFFPDKIQSTPLSIMYLQSLSSVDEFCDAKSHNTEAPNMQNRMCNYKSTWEVIIGSEDFKDTQPSVISSPPPPPTFTILQSRDRVICLVLDVSGSMSSSNRINRARQAAELFLLQIIEMGSYVGIVQFQSVATVNVELTQIDSTETRYDLAKKLPLKANGGTNICSGVEKGFEVIKKRDGSTQGYEIILLTDGEDSGMKSCFIKVKESGSIIHTIALGPNAEKELEQLANMTGGLQFAAQDKLVANELIDAFTGISSGTGDLSQQSVQLESAGLNVAAHNWFNGTVSIDRTVGNDTFFVVTWESIIPEIYLWNPSGTLYKNKNFTEDTTLRVGRLQIPGTAQTGDWIYSLLSPSNQVLTMTVTSRAADRNIAPVTVHAQMNRGTSEQPNLMMVYAEVSQGFLPVLGVKVTAIIEPQSGNSITLSLLDNGSGADTVNNDGIYSKFFMPQNTGRHSLKVRVQGKETTTRLAIRRKNRSMYIPGYQENGQIKLNPLKPPVSDDGLQADLGNFSRTASGGAFIVSDVSSLPYPPSKINDLEAIIQEETVFLSWTAPGDDLDQGQAERYEIRMSENLLQLRDNFTSASIVNTSILTPQLAGSRENFSFIPKNLTIENGTIIFFAVRAFDNSSLHSDTSNIAQAAMISFPSEDPSDGGNEGPANGVSISVIVIAVVAAVTVLCIIISASLCVITKKKQSRISP
nr:PREDICTED: calcium-activated chloride channel regulator 4 [Latimeria chalumnae]|eukprot:XP_006005605.2 PREDICTED: calcium-activated chloride channel regulator 4 [Latimeria chalumnae]